MKRYKVLINTYSFGDLELLSFFLKKSAIKFVKEMKAHDHKKVYVVDTRTNEIVYPPRMVAS